MIEPELQIRLMNLVVGEASDFDRDQLQSLMDERADVAAYYQELVLLHELMNEVGAGDSATGIDWASAGESWQLPAQRRQNMLATLEGRAIEEKAVEDKAVEDKAVEENNVKDKNVESAEPVVFADAGDSKPWSVGLSWWVTGICSGAVLLVLAAFMLPAVHYAQKSVQLSSPNYELAAAAPMSTAQSADGAIMYRSQLQDDVDSLNALTDAKTNGAFSPQSTADRSAALYSLVPPSSGPASPAPIASAPAIPAPVAPDLPFEPAPTKGLPNGGTMLFGGIKRELDESALGNRSDSGATSASRSIEMQLGKQLESGQPAEVESKLSFPKLNEPASGSGREWRELAGTDGSTIPRMNLEPTNNFDLLSIAPAKKDQDQPWRDVQSSPEAKPGSSDYFRAKDGLQDLTELSVAEPAVQQEVPSIESLAVNEALAKARPFDLPGRPGAKATVETLDEQTASVDNFSTFSLHVSDVSFKLAQAALAQGQWPAAETIRIEEFVNAIDYHDPLPSYEERVACKVEQAVHPFVMQRNLLRVSMRTASTGRGQNTPLRLTLLLDNSGSMERPDRRQAVLRAFQSLSSQLTAADQVTLISFASTPRLLADKVSGNQGASLMQLVENLPSEGGTNIEAALTLAREKAIEQKLAGAQNRIVMFTDGAVNLGNAKPESLARLVTQLRDQGIAFDAAGISALDLNDEVLEALTRQGDGRYYLLGASESDTTDFARQIAGALRPSAQNVKVQVEFNPRRVGRYKLLGFDKHRLNKEDFRNDKVDAAELAAAEAGVAVYQYEVKLNGSGEVGSVSVRFRDVATGQMVERRWPILYEPNTPRLDQAEPSIRLAATAAFLAAKLAGGALGESVDFAQLQRMLTGLPEAIDKQTRVQQLRAMVTQASSLSH